MCNSVITTKDGRTYSCGRCEQCHNKYIQHWTFRLQHEMRQTNKSLFLTLTYDYSHLPMNKGKSTLRKKDYQDFLKRLRKRLGDRKIKYVCCGEYGENKHRPHYHLILLGVDVDDFNIINESWGKGSIHVGNVQPQSIAYVFKYATKRSQKPADWRQERQFVAMSKGIGEQFAFTLTYIKTQSTDKNGKTITRNKKLRHIKPHFQKKLDTLLKMPYYTLPSMKGGVVKMSIPRFYLDAANYDKTDLTDMFLDKMQTKYDKFEDSIKNVVIENERKQRKESIKVWEQKVKYSISKEKF